jgi:outer membrane protein OmpA-like peptidoglycan-associated protein
VLLRLHINRKVLLGKNTLTQLFFVLFLSLMPGGLSAQFLEKIECQIYFNSDIDQLSNEAQNIIRSTILELQNQTIKEIYINGHADSDASDTYNIGLSQRRASSTRNFLLSVGVKSRMVKLHAFGESEPISTEKKLNRRVDVVFVYELFSVPGMKVGRKIVQGYVFDATTKKPLPSNFTLEIRGKNDFKKTNKNAYFRLYVDGKNNVNLVFSRSGYWTETVDLPMVKIANVKDTLTLRIYLKPLKVKEKITFDKIYFFTDTHKFKPESQSDLELLLKYMKKNSDAQIEIQGHMNFATNRHASPIQILYNRALSHNRAKAVYLYLMKNGIRTSRMTYKGMSNFQMVYPQPINLEQEDANKRVEVWVMEIADKS